MISLDKEQICLLELLKASLFKTSPIIPDNVDWEKTYEIAKAHYIVPLLSCSVPESHKNEWLSISCQSKAHYMRLLHEQISLCNLIKAIGVPFVILKGTSAAVYYPNPSLRSFGDVDLYTAIDNLEKVRKCLEDNGFLLLYNNERHYGYEKNGIVFELHYTFSCQFYNDIDSYIIKGLESVSEYKIGDSSFPGLPTFENGLVLLGHIMQHLNDSGIGLRQIIDWMMFVHKELDDNSWTEHFRALTVEAGLEKLAIAVTYLCKKWFGLPNKITWCDDADEEVADQLLIRILDEGNFGRDRASSESVKKLMRNEGVFRHLQRAGMINWPLAQKCAIFRPVAWLYQLFRYSGKAFVGLFTGKKVFMTNKPDLSLEELLERLK